MPKIKILSDGTREGTQVIVDGKDLTASVRMLDVSFRAEAFQDYVSFEYQTEEPYTTEKGEEQGKQLHRYTYTNGGWDTQPMEHHPMPGLGQPDMEDAHVGGRILEDVSGASKVNRLIIKERRTR